MRNLWQTSNFGSKEDVIDEYSCAMIAPAKIETRNNAKTREMIKQEKFVVNLDELLRKSGVGALIFAKNDVKYEIN